MQISTKFTIAVHLLAASKYFEKDYKVTSKFLAGSIGSNPVIVRNIMLQLQEAGIIEVKRGTGGITLKRPLRDITYLDVYKAVETNSNEEMFRFHEKPNPVCPVGGTIHKALDQSLNEIQQRFEESLSEYNLQDVLDSIEAAQPTA